MVSMYYCNKKTHLNSVFSFDLPKKTPGNPCMNHHSWVLKVTVGLVFFSGMSPYLHILLHYRNSAIEHFREGISQSKSVSFEIHGFDFIQNMCFLVIWLHCDEHWEPITLFYFNTNIIKCSRNVSSILHVWNHKWNHSLVSDMFWSTCLSELVLLLFSLSLGTMLPEPVPRLSEAACWGWRTPFLYWESCDDTGPSICLRSNSVLVHNCVSRSLWLSPVIIKCSHSFPAHFQCLL